MQIENRRLSRLERSLSKQIQRALKRQGENYVETGNLGSEMQDTLWKAYHKIMHDYAKRQMQWFEQGISKASTDRFFMRWETAIVDYLTRYLFSKVAEIDKTTLESIRKETQPFILGGAPTGDIAAAVRRATSQRYTRARAIMIARTELGNAVAQGKRESSDAWEAETGMKQGKLWIHRGAKDPRSWHQELDTGVPIPKEEPFHVVNPNTGTSEYMDYPHDPNASAENVINCGCTVIYVRMSEDD